ncbi:phage terminase small subunit [Variovorax sp. 278MFTsu5.1]|uniref:phage terminase small subunit n=1 Tax=Variovorax sp. 278MFTsu5.1 TaxID=3158366 RepID=UPI003AAA61E9
MRQTPAQRHLQAKLAKIASAAAGVGGELQGSAYQLMLAQLAEHRRALKDIQSVERKIEAKRAFLPVYDAWIDGVLASNGGAQDQVVTTVLVWHIDAGNYQRAIEIAEYAVTHKLAPPDQYDRNLATILIDEFATAALTGKMDRATARDLLPIVLHGTRDLDAPDQARAKLHKAFGYAVIGRAGSADVDYDKVSADDARLALDHLQRALALFEQVGVKKDIERLERRLNKPETPPAP